MMTNVVKSRRLIIFLAVLGVSALIVVNVTHTGLGYMKLQNLGTFYNGSSTESSATPGYNQLSFFEPFKKMTQKPRRKTVSNNIKYHGIDLLSLVSHMTEAFPCEVGKFRKNHDMRFRYLSHLYESLISRHPEGFEPQYTFDPAYKNPCWNESGTLRCLPYFFLIGVKKCGTTDLFTRLILHPDVQVAVDFKKEAQWFARRRFIEGRDNFSVYIDLFKSATKKIEETYVTLQEKPLIQYHPVITGEGSPSNLHLNSHWDFLPGNENLEEPKYVILDYIHHFLPKAKIIIIFRDPIDRLYSDYFHTMQFLNASDKASRKGFHQAVVEGLQMYNDCFQRHSLRSCVYNHTIHDKTHMQIQLGIYHIYWMELTRLFPRDQILVLQNEECRNTSATMSKVVEFLDLSPTSDDVWSKITKERARLHTTRLPMLDETERLLYDFYKPHNIEMSKIMGDPTFLYEHTFQVVDDTETSLGLMVRNLRLFKDKNKNGRM